MSWKVVQQASYKNNCMLLQKSFKAWIVNVSKAENILWELTAGIPRNVVLFKRILKKHFCLSTLQIEFFKIRAIVNVSNFIESNAWFYYGITKKFNGMLKIYVCLWKIALHQ